MIYVIQYFDQNIYVNFISHVQKKAAIIILIVKWIQGYCPKHNIVYSLIQENKYVGKYSYIDASLGFELLDCYDR